jgi:hypothetical protein
MAKETRTIPVHALGDDRIHLAPPHLGRLRQGQLKTLCGLVAVTALSPFVMAEDSRKRCPACFGTAKPKKPKATESGGKEPPKRPSSARSKQKTPRRG